jgi:SAM-dependent methyltransferase
MPDMFEIYQSHAPRYHELTLAEDFEDNLGSLLLRLVNWHDLSVLEAGVGTGRVTQLYIAQAATAVCCDQSQHMLDFARKSLAAHSPKLNFQLADNTDLPDFGSTFDLFIEGWSFGHTIMACGNAKEILHATSVLLVNAMKNLSSGSTIVIIETLGTNVDAPAPPHENLGLFYETLVHTHGFCQHVTRTDYRFDTMEEAADLLGFFFGDDMKQSVLARGTSTIPEWTGVWTREI